MKRFIETPEYAGRLIEALPRGILLNTRAQRFNTMVIGWGALGTVWSLPAVTVYVREGRFTRRQLDAAGEFTLSIPLGPPDPEITRICGWQSGRDVDKAALAGLTPEPPAETRTPGLREYPLTLECRVLYSQKQALDRIPPDIRQRMYPPEVDGAHPMANRDAHIAYIGQIVSAYIIE